MGRKMPELLYHYTSIETLELILKNRTIRFNNLSRVDDKEEGRVKEIGSIGKFIYVSCWTDGPEEIQKMWEKYASGMTGVRISLPIKPFNNKPEIIVNGINDSKWYDECTFKRRIVCDFTIPEWEPWVEYTKSEKRLLPKLIKYRYEKGKRVAKISLPGYIKREKCWGYQKECRYILHFVPDGSKFCNSLRGYKIKELIIKSYNDETQIPYSDVYLRISDEFFEKMEIMLGPKANDEQKSTVKSLIENYNPMAKLTESMLAGKI